ncbi:MAG: hypothetical protein RR882_00435 [Comamonas sp.]
MQITAHVEKITRLLDLRERLDPQDDFELWYWTSLTAGTNMWNASLHATGLTPEDRAFSTIPGVHVVPQADGSFRRELRGPGDVSHVGWPEVPGIFPQPLQRLEAALHALEQHRDPCIRSNHPATACVIKACEDTFDQALCAYQSLVQERSFA